MRRAFTPTKRLLATHSSFKFAQPFVAPLSHAEVLDLPNKATTTTFVHRELNQDGIIELLKDMDGTVLGKRYWPPGTKEVEVVQVVEFDSSEIEGTQETTEEDHRDEEKDLTASGGLYDTEFEEVEEPYTAEELERALAPEKRRQDLRESRARCEVRERVAKEEELINRVKDKQRKARQKADALLQVAMAMDEDDLSPADDLAPVEDDM
ncbi:hypothetical protein T439DRAFT_381327 [Meredithblackwellia eburnea MCA 4105]